MPTPDLHALAPMIHKLKRRSKLEAIAIQALLGLPYRLVVSNSDNSLIREGETSDSCVLLLSGLVYRSTIAGSGARKTLSVHLRGDLVNLQNSLPGKADYSVRTLTCAVVAYIPQRAVLAVAEAFPTVARALWLQTLVDGSIFREWTLNVGQCKARQRIAHLLCELSLRQEEAGLCEGPSYEWPMTQMQIGTATGLTPVHVNRTIQGMRRDGLIGTRNRWVTITDWPGLQKVGDFRPAYLHQIELAA